MSDDSDESTDLEDKESEDSDEELPTDGQQSSNLDDSKAQMEQVGQFLDQQEAEETRRRESPLFHQKSEYKKAFNKCGEYDNAYKARMNELRLRP